MGYCNPRLDSLLAQRAVPSTRTSASDCIRRRHRSSGPMQSGIFPGDLKNNAAVRKEVQGFELPVMPNTGDP
jgi:hypothetical protein